MVLKSQKIIVRRVRINGFNECYNKARQKAAIETGLLIETFSVESPLTPKETLNPEYLPD
ncbi:DUF29 family protein [Hydrococcus rivularis]|uniref:DUF29 family protein n=1 Tax=Hydrococcus rivularis TaxID=1616834 RepID=UPI001114847C